MHHCTSMMAGRLPLLICLIITSIMGMLLFTYFQENQKLAIALKGLNSRLKRSKTLLTKLEKKYKTSHGNEESYAISNRELQLTLARQEKSLAHINNELEGERSKLTTAHAFYASMKDLFGISSQSDTHEKILDEATVKKISEKATKWKGMVKTCKAIKKNYTEIKKQHEEVNGVLNSLHHNHRKMQLASVNVSFEINNLKKLYDELLFKYKNVTNLYQLQVDGNKKLQRQLARAKGRKKGDKTRSHVSKGMKDKVKVTPSNTSTSQHEVTTNVGKEGVGGVVHATIAPHIDTTEQPATTHAALKESIPATTSGRETLKPSLLKPSVPVKVANTVNRSTVVQPANNSARIPPRDMKTIVRPLTPIPESELVVRGLKKRQQHNQSSKESMQHLHVDIEHLPRASSEQTREQTHDRVASTSRPATTMQDTSIDTSLNSNPLSASDASSGKHVGASSKKHVDAVKEYLDKDSEFDAEEKYEPPHINDVLDANGLSQRATAD